MQKFAYLIVANSNFKILDLCLKMIDDPRNDIYLLFDLKSKVNQEQICKMKKKILKSRIFICEPIVVNWAGYSQIDAVLKLIVAANGADVNYSYIHFFQGSDMPIKSQNEICEYFNQNNGSEFVSVEKSRTAMAQRKAWYRHFFCHNRFFRKNKFVKALNFGFVYVQKILHIRKNLDIDLYQGSALFSITGKCAKYVETQIPNIRKRFRYSLAADEVFLQSILMSSPFRDKIMDINLETSSNARLIDRSRPDGKNSPHIWRKQELDYLLSLPSNYCFARKFDEKVDLEVAQLLCYSISNEEI